jgi:hypothetical protein
LYNIFILGTNGFIFSLFCIMTLSSSKKAGSSFPQLIGSRAQVWHGTAYKTTGGLTKRDLMMSHGRVVSRKKHFTAKKEKRLEKAGYFAKKGSFGFIKKTLKSRRRGRKMRGGNEDETMLPNDQQPVDDVTLEETVVPESMLPNDKEVDVTEKVMSVTGGRRKRKCGTKRGGKGVAHHSMNHFKYHSPSHHSMQHYKYK